MPKTLRINDQGKAVAILQKKLGIKADGIFGPATQKAVVDLQDASNIYTDGIVGMNTWRAIQAAGKPLPPNHIVRVSLDKWRDGYDSASLASTTAEKVEMIREELGWMGGILTSSGGTRSLHANVGKNRSATSFHYSGLALDLFVYSGMSKPQIDPYVIEKDGDYWTVWAKTLRGGTDRTLQAFKYDLTTTPIEGHFVNLTEMFAKQGMQRIRPRASFWRGGNNGSAEWWHFQDESGLVKGETFFGDLLTAAHGNSRLLLNSPPWDFRHYIFGVDFH